MTARPELLPSAREQAPVRDPVEPEAPPKLARGSSRVVSNDVTRDLPRRQSSPDLSLSRRNTMRRGPTVLAIAFLAAYLGQAVMRLEIAGLAALQGDDVYKSATGSVLVAFIAMQWLCARRSRDLHLWLGAFAPVVLYAHATKLGYGYLAWLVVVYLGIGAIGLLHRPIISHRARRLYVAWFITHLALSVFLLVLAGYHVVIAIGYE